MHKRLFLGASALVLSALASTTLMAQDNKFRIGIENVVTVVSDYGPGIDAERYFKDRFLLNGGKVTDSLRVPLRNPDFAPILQKVRDLKPDAMFVFVPSGAGAAVMKQFTVKDPGKSRLA